MFNSVHILFYNSLVFISPLHICLCFPQQSDNTDSMEEDYDADDERTDDEDNRDEDEDDQEKVHLRTLISDCVHCLKPGGSYL